MSILKFGYGSVTIDGYGNGSASTTEDTGHDWGLSSVEERTRRGIVSSLHHQWPVSALGMAIHPQGSSFHYWRLSSVQSGKYYLPCSRVTVLLPLMGFIW